MIADFINRDSEQQGVISMVGVRVEVVCPVCDNTEYVLRQGQYFCRMCNTQSQELGMETVMDDETIPLEVQGRKGAVTVGKNRRQRRKKRSLCNAVRWDCRGLQLGVEGLGGPIEEHWGGCGDCGDPAVDTLS